MPPTVNENASLGGITEATLSAATSAKRRFVPGRRAVAGELVAVQSLEVSWPPRPRQHG